MSRLHSPPMRTMRGIFFRVFQDVGTTAPVLSEKMQDRIASLSEIVAMARTHVDRNSYGGREIEFVPEPEANTRISKGLAAIAKGIAALYSRKEVAEVDLQDCFRVGMDSIPDRRRGILLELLTGKTSVRMPRTTRQRELEEMEELELVQKADDGTYEISKKVSRLWGKVNAS